jgi:hypothetical protein
VSCAIFILPAPEQLNAAINSLMKEIDWEKIDVLAKVWC